MFKFSGIIKFNPSFYRYLMERGGNRDIILISKASQIFYGKKRRYPVHFKTGDCHIKRRNSPEILIRLRWQYIDDTVFFLPVIFGI